MIGADIDSRIQPMPFNASAIRGLSEKLLVSHHENNYGGAVKRLNAIRAQLAKIAFSTAPGFAINGLKREELIANNSMILHELYFDFLGGDGTTMEPGMALALAADFGRFQRWREEFVAIGKALGGGSGWVLLVFQPREGTLVKQWAADHAQTLARGVPILALDMYEHAYHLDYGAAAGRYVDALMGSLDRAKICTRYKAAVDAASEPFAASRDDVSTAVLLDVRRAPVFEKATTVIPRQSVARSGTRRRVVSRAGTRSSGRRVLPLRARSGTRHRASLACGRRRCAFPARWHGRLQRDGRHLAPKS
jgi:superoxide dismutase, Fe-Mn family